jgi:hypothetical protein
MVNYIWVQKSTIYRYTHTHTHTHIHIHENVWRKVVRLEDPK